MIGPQSEEFSQLLRVFPIVGQPERVPVYKESLAQGHHGPPTRSHTVPDGSTDSDLLAYHCRQPNVAGHGDLPRPYG